MPEPDSIRLLFLPLGLLLVALALIDLFWTTIAVSSGAGPLTRRLGRALWLAGRRRRAKGAKTALSGVGIATATLAAWLALLWGGWALVFSSTEQAVVATSTGVPTGILERFYFAGYATATLGNGELQPHGFAWQVATVLASLTGLALATLAITYLLSVVSAASERRSVAVQINQFGGDPAEVAATLVQPDAYDLKVISASVTDLAERHLAFPILHYFHAPQRTASAPYALALLDEALTALELGADAGWHRERPALRRLRRTLDRYWSTVDTRDVGGDLDEEVEPDIAVDVESLSIPAAGEAADPAARRAAVERRRRIDRMLQEDGWDWNDVRRQRRDAEAGTRESGEH